MILPITVTEDLSTRDGVIINLVLVPTKRSLYL